MYSILFMTQEESRKTDVITQLQQTRSCCSSLSQDQTANSSVSLLTAIICSKHELNGFFFVHY